MPHNEPTTASSSPTASKELIGLRIETRRRELDMSKADLARACSTNEGNVWKWITGMQRPSTNKIGLIAAALKTTIEELIKPPVGEASSSVERQLLAELLPKARNEAERDLIRESVKRALSAVSAPKPAEAAPAAKTVRETPSSTPPPKQRRKHA